MEGKTGLVHFTNPVLNSLELVFSKTDESACDLRLFDLQGRLLFQKTTDQPVEKLDLNDLPGGQFLLRCECGGQTETHRLVKAN